MGIIGDNIMGYFGVWKYSLLEYLVDLFLPQKKSIKIGGISVFIFNC